MLQACDRCGRGAVVRHARVNVERISQIGHRQAVILQDLHVPYSLAVDSTTADEPHVVCAPVWAGDGGHGLNGSAAPDLVPCPPDDPALAVVGQRSELTVAEDTP